MARRPPWSPTMPSATTRPPGAIPATCLRPRNTRAIPPVLSTRHAFEGGHAGPRLHPERAHLAGDPRPLPVGHLGDRRDALGDLAGLHDRRSHRRGGRLRLSPGVAPFAVAAEAGVAGRPGGSGRPRPPAWWRRRGGRARRSRWRGAARRRRRRWRRRCGRGAAGATTGVYTRRGRSRLTSVSPSIRFSAHSSTAARVMRRSGTSIISRGSRARPRRRHSSDRPVGVLAVDDEVDGPQLVGHEGPGVLDGPGGGHVEVVDQHEHHVAAQDGLLGRPRGVLAPARLPRPRTAC